MNYSFEKTIASIIAIIALTLSASYSFASSNDLNFSISTNNIYFPGDEVKLMINTYNYSDKSDRNRSFAFKISILKIKDVNAFYSKQSSRYGVDVLSKDSLNLTYLTEEVSTFEKKLKSKKDYGYSYINETIPINVFSKGAYIIKVTAGNKVAYCGFLISSLGLISKAGNNSMLGFVVDRKTGNPVNGCNLNFYIGQENVGQGATTDGICFRRITDQEKTSREKDVSPIIIGQFNDDIVLSDSYLFFGYSANKYYTYIFTEQPVYRTNSDVNFKGTIRKNSIDGLEPFASKELTVKITDSRGGEVYKNVMRTNDMGSFDGKYHIDEDANLGSYTITAYVEENISYSASFSVEQYKKPEYKVTVAMDKGQYFGKDVLKAEVDAKYFFGSPVTDADVEYNIFKVRYYKPWWMYSEYSWWYEDYYNELDDNQKYRGAEQIFSGTGKLNAEGKMEIEYSINEKFEEENAEYNGWYRPYYSESDYRYIVQAKVTDKSRREISGTASAFVTRGGFALSANTDKYLYKPGEQVNINVYASDFSNKPVRTNFEATIYKNKWERDNSKESKDFFKTIMGNTQSDGKGMISFDLGNNDVEGAYSVEIEAKDERSNEITASAYFYVSSGDMWWYYNQSGGVQIIPDKDSYKVGEVCRAFIITSNPDVNVLVTTNTDDILSYSLNKFNGTSKMIEIPVTNKYESGFEINVNYVTDGTFYNAGKKILVIPEEKFLTVTIDPSKLIYIPKETGELRIKVTDASGNPVRNAEVSIGIVDESIYSIKEDNTKDIRKFFYGQKEMYVSTGYNNIYNSNGRSRLITIYERFNMKSTSEGELATVKGRLLRTNGVAIPNAVIVVDEDYEAAVTDQEGNFEFRLPEGEYTVGAYYEKISKEDLMELKLKKGELKTITIYNDKDLNEAPYSKSDVQSGTIETDAMELRAGREDMKTNSAPMKKMKGYDSEKDGESGLVAPDVRSDFRDAIFWSPFEKTDDDGNAVVSVSYPDNLTEWRITSRVITEDTKVGQMTATVITRKDLLVRMETPRFMQQNDEVTVSTIIHNYLDNTKQTRVKFISENAQLLNAENEKTISIAPDTDVRLDWKIKVTQPVGEAKFYAEALTDEESDALELKVPLQPRGLQMNVSTVADFSDETKSETKFVNIPDYADMRSAGLKFNVDPSLASAILTALDELVGYPYGCVEQTMSRFLPTVVVANAFRQLNAPISEATKKDLPKMVDKGLQRLYSFQHSDGGWGWWENDETNPFMTAYVVYGLSLAKQADYEINETTLSRGISSIKSQLNNSANLDATTRAYMLYSLAVAQERDEQFFREQMSKIISKNINDYARALIAMTWKLIGDNSKADDALSALIKEVKLAGEGAAYWEGQQFHYRWQDDKVQTTAMALKAIVNINEKSDLKDKVVRWLMMQRQGMAWRNTQETAMIVYAMVDYLKNSNELNPDYSVKVYVNNEIVFDKQMTSGDVFKKSQTIKIENNRLKNGANEIRIEKSGRGKVYFASNTTYYQPAENVSANEAGFRVEREYFKLEKYIAYDDDKITYRKKYFDGIANSGEDILVKLKVYSKDENLQYFMLEDPLPSGIEVVKDDWAFTIEGENNYGGYDYYYWRWWYADKDVRDNKVTFFATYMGKGEYEFSYIMHAQIPGDYTVNPARGMLMYYPEVTGNTGTEKFTIRE